MYTSFSPLILWALFCHSCIFLHGTSAHDTNTHFSDFNLLPQRQERAVQQQSTEAFTATFLEGRYLLRWQVLPGNEEINITIEAATVGWVAIGIPTTPGQMLQTDAWIGWVNSNGSVHVGDYFITARQPGCPGVCPDGNQGGIDDVLSFSGFERDGKTTISFVRKFNTGDSNLDNPISTTGVTDIVYSMGSSDTLAYHGSSNRGAGAVNFASGQASTTGINNQQHKRVWHGALMFAAFLVFFPLGIFLPAFFKWIGEWWFRIHVLNQVLTVLLVYSSFIIIIEWTASQQLGHFRAPHQRLGLSIVIIMTITPFFGMLADFMYDPHRKRVPLFPDMVHCFFGYSTIILAWVNVYLGLHKIKADAVWWVLVAVWMGIVAVAFTVLTGFRIASGGNFMKKKWLQKKGKTLPAKNGNNGAPAQVNPST